MIKINIKNVEELIFYDRKIHKLFPEFKNFFDQWSLAQSTPGLKTLASRTSLEFLNSLREEHTRLLEEYFRDKVFIEKLNSDLIANFESSLDNIEGLCKFTAYKDFCLTRNRENLKITFWR